VRLEHTLIHLFEELGEVAREILKSSGYKDGQLHITEELADAGLLLYKLANQLDVDLEEAMLRKLDSNEKRFPLEESRTMMDRYLATNNED